MDFASPSASHTIGERIKDLESTPTIGYDHNYVLHRLGAAVKDAATAAGGLLPASKVQLAARVEHPASGRYVEVHTNAPGCQIYTGNWISDARGKNGVVYQRNAGVAIESQTHPDAVNRRAHVGFPDPVVAPGQLYEHIWTAKFGELY